MKSRSSENTTEQKRQKGSSGPARSRGGKSRYGHPYRIKPSDAPERAEASLLKNARASYVTLVELVKLSGALKRSGDLFFRSQGITQAQFNLLMVLKNAPASGCTQTELCKQLLVHGANMTALVRKLSGRKLIARDTDPHDTRVWLVSITEKGKQLLREVEQSYFRVVDRVMGIHSSKELAQLLRQLQQTQEALEDETRRAAEERSNRRK